MTAPERVRPLRRLPGQQLHCQVGGVRRNGPHATLRGNGTGLWGDCSGLSGDCTGLRGDCTGLRGDCSGLRGDCSGLWDDCTGLRGDCTGLRGNCTGLWGDLDLIPLADRTAHPSLADWTAEVSDDHS